MALNIGRDSKFFEHPDLPETQSELALPLKSGNEIIGVLDIQSTTANDFTETDIATLSILADQVGSAQRAIDTMGLSPSR
jgi:putative methionine-R-sulfoxide reductase with GAF domain